MRRFFHGLLVGVLTLWIPIDSAVAGWWHHHHRHAMPVAWGPAFPPSCGMGAPFPGWAGAVVIDDRPLGAPSPFALFAAPPAEVVVDSWIATGPVEGAMVDEGIVIHEGTILDEGTIVDEGSIDAGDCACDPCHGESSADTGMAFDGPVIATEAPGSFDGMIESESVIGLPTPADAAIGSDEGSVMTQRPTEALVPPNRVENNRVETTPEAESPTPLELPGTAATTSGDPAAASLPGTTDEPAASVLEPWEPKTVQGDTAAETASDEPPAETMDEAEAFERAETPADVDSTDEPMADDADTAPPAQPKRRNLFDEAPADEAEAFESPRTSDDEALPPNDAFDAPDDAFEAPEDAMESTEGGDDAFGIPAEPPMDDAPADDMEQDGFDSAADEVMDETPADEPAIEEPASDEPAVDEPATEEAPAETDPFDAKVLHTPGQPTRAWRDDTGRHGTEGRLVEVHADRVRILKATGRYTTVPMTRLSRADRDHVAGVALALSRPTARPAETAGL